MQLEMHEVVDCALCGSDVLAESERSYRVTEHAALCFECAVRSGGVYDDVRRCWAVVPCTSVLQGRASAAESPRRYRAYVCPQRRAEAPAGRDSSRNAGMRRA